MSIRFQIVFETLELFSGFMCDPRCWVCMRPLLWLWGSRGCPRPAVMPAVVIWNQFDPLTVKCPVCPQHTLPYGCMDMVLFGINTTTTPVSHKSWNCMSTSPLSHMRIRWLRGQMLKHKVDLTDLCWENIFVFFFLSWILGPCLLLL